MRARRKRGVPEPEPAPELAALAAEVAELRRVVIELRDLLIEPTDPDVLTIGAAAARLGLSRATTYRLIERGKLRAVTREGLAGMRVLPEDIDAYLATLRPVPVRDDGLPHRSRSRGVQH